jgi:hypothetical protein
MTSSNYLFGGITEEVWTWEQTNYLMFPCRYNRQRANWQSLQAKVKKLEATGISAKWWLVAPNDISRGGIFANELLVNAMLASKPEPATGPSRNNSIDQKGPPLEKDRAEFFKN